MFFKTKLDGIEFGYRLARMTASTVEKVDRAVEQRLSLPPDAFGRIGILRELDIHINSVLNPREFTTIWVFALKELILLSTKDRSAAKINAGFVQFLNEKYSSEADVWLLQSKVKQLIDNDLEFARTGQLQAYDYNNNAPIAQRRGISYDIARLVLNESLLREEGIIGDNKDLLISLLVLEFETLYGLSAKTYRSLKII